MHIYKELLIFKANLIHRGMANLGVLAREYNLLCDDYGWEELKTKDVTGHTMGNWVRNLKALTFRQRLLPYNREEEAKQYKEGTAKEEEKDTAKEEEKDAAKEEEKDATKEEEKEEEKSKSNTSTKKYECRF